MFCDKRLYFLFLFLFVGSALALSRQKMRFHGGFLPEGRDQLNLLGGVGYHYSFTGGLDGSLALQQTFNNTSVGYMIGLRYNRDAYFNTADGVFYPKSVFAKHMGTLDFGVYYSLSKILSRKKVFYSRRASMSLLDIGFSLGTALHYQLLAKERKNMMLFRLNPTSHFVNAGNTNKFLFGLYTDVNVKVYFSQRVFVFGRVTLEYIATGINDNLNIARSMNRALTPFLEGGLGVNMN